MTYTQIDNAREQLDAMFATPLVDKATVAAAAVAQRRFGNAPWAQDRVQDAAFYAWASWVGYNTTATDGSAIPAYRPAENGKDDVYTRVNRILGMADGLGRQAATQESELDAFIGCFSDLVPDGVDEDAATYLEERLGGTVTFSPAVAKAYNEDFDGYASTLDNAAFYVTDESGRKQALSLRTVAARLAQLSDAQMEELFASADIDMAVEHYSEVLDRIVTWAMSHDSVVQLVTEEPEPEAEPEYVETRITNMKTSETRVEQVEIKRPNYSVQRSDDEAYEAAFDFAVEEFKSVKADNWKRWRHDLDMSIAALKSPDPTVAANAARAVEMLENAQLHVSYGGAYELEMKGYGEAGEIDTLCDVEEGFTLRQEIDFEDAQAAIDMLRTLKPWTQVQLCVVMVKRNEQFVEQDLSPARAYVKAWRKGLHQHIGWRVCYNGSLSMNNDARLAVAHGIKLGDEQGMYDIETLPDHIEGMGHELMSVIAVGATAVGHDAYIAHVAKEDEDFFSILVALAPKAAALNGNLFDTAELREVILAEVDAGRMYPSQAAILLAKLAGKHQNAAKRVGQLVYENSVAKKQLLGQKRVDQKVELLWAEQESRGLFGLELPKHLVAVVGKLSEHAIADFERWSAKIRSECAIVGCSADAQQLAEKYNIRYIEVPVFQGYNGPMTTWAEMQAISIGNLSYVGQCNQTKVKAMARAFGHRFIGLTK